MSKHTPGPWKVFVDNRERDGEWHVSGYNIEAADGGYVVGDEGICCRQDDEANARLIAAAPELLEALQMLVGQAGEGATFSERITKAVAAIAKATGETK